MVAPDAESRPVDFRLFAIGALLWLVTAYLSAQVFAKLPFGFVVFSVLLFAVPIALSGIYSCTVTQIRHVSYFETSGWLYWLFSQRLLRSIIWVLWALGTSFLMLLQFSTYSGWEWFALTLVIPSYWLIYSISHRLLSRELKKSYIVTSMSIVWTRVLCPIVTLAIYALLIWNFAGVQGYASLGEAIAAKRTSIPDPAGSSVVQVGLQLATFMDGTKAYLASGQMPFGDYLPLCLTILGGFVVFFNACASLACFVIPLHEFRRVFGQLSDEDVTQPLSHKRITMVTAVITFISLFVYVPLFSNLEERVRNNPDVLAAVKKIEHEVERIDGALYNPGTIEKIQTAKAVALGKLNVSMAVLDGQIDRAFVRMEQNVDGYLNWYYSLPAEYVRIAKLLTGQLEDHLAEQLASRLQQNAAFKILEDGIKGALDTNDSVLNEYQLTVKVILDANRVSIPPQIATVLQTTSLGDVIDLPNHLDAVSLKNRVSGGGLAAGSAGIATASLTKTIFSKGIFKTAAKALSKVVASKVAGSLGGAVIGGAIGSVIPGAGTVIGAAIGGIVGGVAAGVGAESVLLKLEEEYSRAAFKNELLSAIRESRVEFRKKILGKS